MSDRMGLLLRFCSALLFLLALGTSYSILAQQDVNDTSKPGKFSVARIFSEPSLNGHLTQAIAWAPDGKRLSYLENPANGAASGFELWVMDAASGKRSQLISAKEMDAALPSRPDDEGFSSETTERFQLRYQWAPDGKGLLLMGPRTLVWFDLESHGARRLASGSEGLSDPKISPDGRYVSFVRDHNLWLASVRDGKQRPLTEGGSEQIRKGELDFLYRHEFHLPTGYWWSPDSSAIAYLEMDERKVPQFPLVDFDSFVGEFELQRYPVPGAPNSDVRVFVARVNGRAAQPMDLGDSTDVYLPRVTWLPDSKHLAIQRLNRPQTNLDVLLFDTATGKAKVLLSEKDAYWVNVSDDFRFLDEGKRLIWSSERSGYRHLYLYDFSGKPPLQLTRGEWEVTRLDAVDEQRNAIYFTATEKSPLERQLYRVAFDGSGLTRISAQDGAHTLNFAPDVASYLDTYSNASTPPRQDLYQADGTMLAALNENKVADLAKYGLSPIEFFTIRTHDGVSLNCSMIKPAHFDAAKKYPVLVYINGGPGAQTVLNAWGGNRFLWHELMAEKGYVIFSVDNRGSGGRGHLFEEPIHYRLGAQELSDQRDGVHWLRSQPYVDPNRIGIWGWGYGGQMTLHAMFEAPSVFKAGFAGAPVSDWRFYDSAFAERYIGPLPAYQDSYLESAPIENASKLQGRLLIAHGTEDEVVHYSNTLALLDELTEAGKYVEVISLPGRKHIVNDAAAERLLWDRVTKFFLDNL